MAPVERSDVDESIPEFRASAAVEVGDNIASACRIQFIIRLKEPRVGLPRHFSYAIGCDASDAADARANAQDFSEDVRIATELVKPGVFAENEQRHVARGFPVSSHVAGRPSD